MDKHLLGQEPWLKNQALSWLTRLPFLDAYELSMLLDINTKKTEWLLHDLGSIHWIDQVSPSSPEFVTQPLHLLTAGAVTALSNQLGLPVSEVEARFPVGQRDIVLRLARLEAYTYMNRIFACLADGLRKKNLGYAVELRSRPLAHRSESLWWWPSGIEGYGCLRGGMGWAPFFVAMEIHQVPVAHRRKLIADWYAFRDESHGWGDYWLPPIFVVTGDSHATDQWARAVMSAGDRRQVSTPDIRLADIETIFSNGFLNTAWTKPDGTSVSGYQGLSGRNEPDATFARWLPGEKAPSPLPPSRPQLQAWANQVAGALPRGKLAGTSEELGALSLVLPATDKTAVEFLGEHPMLTPRELGVMLRLPWRRAERLVSGLARDHLIESLPPLGDEPSSEPRYLLTELGLKLLAARAGVPYRAYVRGGPFLGRTLDREGQHRLGPLLYHPEHTAGINRFLASMAAAPAGEAPRLTRWFGTSESTFWLNQNESRNWLQPDAQGNLSLKGKTRRFFLEWDRGTMRWQEMNEKFDRYASLYSSFACSANPWTPDTVIVTSSPQRESSIWERWQSTMAENEAPPSLLITSVESLVARLGPFDSVWRTSAEDLRRYTWGEAIDLWEGTPDG